MALRKLVSMLAAVVIASVLGTTAASRAATTSNTFTGTVSASGTVSQTFTINVTDTSVPITASLDWTTTGADLNLFLTPPGSTTAVAQATSKTNRPETVSFNPTVTGTYKLRVKAVTGSSAFTLDAAWGGAGGGGGGTPTQVFTGGVSATGTVSVRHTFQVNDLSAPITASLDWATTSANLNLFLTGPGSSTTLAQAATKNRPEQLSYTPTVKGTYTLRVKAVSGASSYTLSVNWATGDDGGGGGGTPGPDWPMFGQDMEHHGISADSTITAANAASLGLDWAVNTGSESYTSPVVGHSSSLNKDLVYAANQMGALSAYDAHTGVRQWVLQLAASIQSSPALHENTLYFGANDHKLHAVNASTGQEICSYTTPGNISSSPVVIGSGSAAVVYFGENGVTGADDGGHEFAIDASTCALKWTFSGFGDPQAGSWSPPAYATDVNGRHLIVFGGSSPDCAVYAVDAANGHLVWRFQTQIFAQDNDVGAGPTISDPGVNGFADGVVYVSGKDRIVYALNLRTGEKLWEFSIRSDSLSVGGATRSTAALLGNRLYVGYGAGVYALNAVTGQKVWKTQDFGLTTQEVIASPAITGDSASGRVLFAGDTDGQGKFRAFTLDGALKWTYTTGAFIYGSPAIADGHVYTTSSDGFLYAFAPGGAIGPKPETTISAPADGDTIPNTGSVSVTGTATDNAAVSKVLVAVKNKNSGAWWDAAQQKWTKTYQETAASLGNPGGTSTGWSMSFPVPATGAPFVIEASAVDNGGQHDPTPDRHQVLVPSTGNPPETTITSPLFRQVFHPPVDNDPDHFGLFVVPYTITVTGTATDGGGAHPGIQQVLITVRNIEHAEYNCGPATGALKEGCWQPTLITEQATLANPGATSTNWTFQFPIYDHPHKYRIVAWAVDKDGEVDTTRASVDRICLRNPGDDTCA